MSERRAAGPDWMRDERFVGALLVLVVLVAYSTAIFVGRFHFDDFHNAAENEHVRTLANVPRFFADASTWSAEPGNVMYRPVLMTTYAADFAIWGLRGAGWVLTNTLLHAAVVVLLWRLARRLGLSREASILAAGVMAVHPAFSEVVNYVSSRSESLAAIGVLGALLLHLSAMERVGAGTKAAVAGRVAAACACAAASLLAKETSALLFAGVALLEILRPSAPDRPVGARVAAAALCAAAVACGLVLRAGGEKAMSSILLAAGAAGAAAAWVPVRRVRGAACAAAPFLFVLGVVMVVRSSVLSHATAPVAIFTTPEDADAQSGGRISVLDNLLHTQSRVVVLYFQTLLRPVLLSVDHDVTRRSSWAWTDAAALALHAAIAAFAIREALRGRRLVPLCIGWFWLFIAPSVAYPMNVVMNEHRLYLPGLAVSLAAGAALARVADVLAARGSRRALATAAAPLVVLTLLSAVRSWEWRSETALWEAAVRRAPESARARMHHGAALHSDFSRLPPGSDDALLDRAIARYREAESMYPAYYDAQLNLGMALLQRGRVRSSQEDFAEALESFRRAGRTVGEHWYRPRFWQSQALAELRRWDEACDILRALRDGDDSGTTMYDDAEARIRRRAGDRAAAYALAENVIRVKEPEGDVDPLLLLAWWKFEDGDVPGARDLIDRAIGVTNRNVREKRDASFLPYLYAARMMVLLGMAGPEADSMLVTAKKLGWTAEPDEVGWVMGGATPGPMRGTRDLPPYGLPR